MKILWNIHIVMLQHGSTYPITWQLGQVKLPVGQVDLSNVLFYSQYNQIIKMHNFGNQADKKIEIQEALHSPEKSIFPVVGNSAAHCSL